MKLIRESRMGPPMSGKTPMVVGTYPKPLLVFMFDRGGLESLPSKGQSVPANWFKTDTVLEDIETIKATTQRADKDPSRAKWHLRFEELCKTPTDKLPKVTAIDLYSIRAGEFSALYTPTPEKYGYIDFVSAVNLLNKNCPWKTIVLDPLTGLSETVMSHMADVQGDKKFADARKWTPDVGYQSVRTIATLSDLEAHLVVISHITSTRNEKGETTSTQIMVPSQFARDRLGGLFLQSFYAEKYNGLPHLRTSDFGFVKGLGAKWPIGLKDPCGPTFQDIYGKESGLL